MKFVGLFLTLSLWASTACATPVDIVFDIDWTTFYTINKNDSNQFDDKALFVEDKVYRPTDHLGEVLEKLLAQPDVRISFFSGGERSRNEALLKAFKLPSGRSAFDIAFRVFSKEHLTVISSDPNLKFADKNKKVLAGLLPDGNPARTILIDDQVKFAVTPWKAVDSMGHFEFQLRFDPTKTNQQNYPTSAEAWIAEKDKALMWNALLEEALETSNKSRNSFSDSISEIWAQKFQHPLCKNIFTY